MPRGKVVLVLGDDVSTDIIYPGRFMATVLPSETPRHAFADDAVFHGRLEAGEIPPGSVIVAGRNFGCGSSREQAASCLRGRGLAVIARNFARIFLQNSVNLGLDAVICPTLETATGHEVEVREGAVHDLATGRSFPVVPLPRARQAILDAGGLVAYTRRRLVEKGAAAGSPSVRE